MKPLKLALFAVLLAFLTMGLAACGDASEQAPATEAANASAAATNTSVPNPTDTPLPPPSATPQPEATEVLEPTESSPPSIEPSDTQGLDLGGLQQPSDLDSFRSNLTISWQGTYTDGTEVSESMMVDVEFVREPPAQHVSISGDFPGMEDLGMEEGQALEMYVAEGMMYMNLFGSWLQAPAEEGGLDADEMAFVATEEMLKGLQDAEFQGTTTYNGIEADHYTFTETSFSPDDMPEGMDVEEASGNIYIAQDGNYVVHMDVTMSGANIELPTGEAGQVLQAGTMEVIVDLTDINEPITIQVPEEAQASGQPPDDIPLPDNAEDVQVLDFMGMITFYTESTSQEVAEFYQAEMPNYGWSEETVEQMGDTFSLEFVKSIQTAAFLISLDTETNQTSVLITVEGGE